MASFIENMLSTANDLANREKAVKIAHFALTLDRVELDCNGDTSKPAGLEI